MSTHKFGKTSPGPSLNENSFQRYLDGSMRYKIYSSRKNIVNFMVAYMKRKRIDKFLHILTAGVYD